MAHPISSMVAASRSELKALGTLSPEDLLPQIPAEGGVRWNAVSTENRVPFFFGSSLGKREFEVSIVL